MADGSRRARAVLHGRMRWRLHDDGRKDGQVVQDRRGRSLRRQDLGERQADRAKGRVDNQIALVAQVRLPSLCSTYARRDGNYFLRTELIALHGASAPGGAQLYPACLTIALSGGGSDVPTDTVSFPGAYKATDPGLVVNVWGDLSAYTIRASERRPPG